MTASTAWKETIAPDEDAQFTHYAEQLLKLRDGTGRVLHAKGNLGVEARFEVLADLPADCRHGMFATPKSYPALVRYSNGAPRHQGDHKPDVRGIAVKVIGVDGEKTIPGLESAVTQDFLAIRTPTTPVRDAHEFVKVVQAARSPALLPFRLIASMGPRRAITVIKKALAGFRVPTAPLAATTYYSALPSQLGPYAVQYVFVPRDPQGKTAHPKDLGGELATRLREADVIYDLHVKFFVDEATTPIEDASVEWPGELFKVATLTLVKQDVSSERGKHLSDEIEALSFDPWHTRKDMRPLGNMMRARNHAYRVSTQARKAKAEPTAML
ncbi:MAG: catalase [Kofleriaceae bacterium]